MKNITAKRRTGVPEVFDVAVAESSNWNIAKVGEREKEFSRCSWIPSAIHGTSFSKRNRPPPLFHPSFVDHERTCRAPQFSRTIHPPAIFLPREPSLAPFPLNRTPRRLDSRIFFQSLYTRCARKFLLCKLIRLLNSVVWFLKTWNKIVIIKLYHLKLSYLLKETRRRVPFSLAPHLSLLSPLFLSLWSSIPSSLTSTIRSDLDGETTRNRTKRADKNWFSVIECENCISTSMRVQDIW